MAAHLKAITRIAWLGFGQVAVTLSQPLAAHAALLSAYDLLLEQPGGEAALRARAEGAPGGPLPVRLAPLAEALAGADLILSAVTAEVALEVAERAAPHLRAEQTYLDLNSTAPTVKVAIGEALASSGVEYVEGAVLDAIGVAGARAHILLGGPAAQGLAAALRALGLNAAFYRAEIGAASTFKMLRSVLTKGLEALLIEFLLAGRQAGLADDLWADMADFFQRTSFERAADNWVASHGAAHERRYHEMAQAAETLRALGVEPLMTAATVAFFRRSTALGLAGALPPSGAGRDEVLAALARRLAAAEG